jgi:ligand-binding SRPBCC domain-containing protein
LKLFRSSFRISCAQERVWEFYTDVHHLKIVTPKELDLNVVDCTCRKFTQGTEFRIEGKILFQKREWRSVITSIRPYEYVDIMLAGPFKRWKHIHKFLYDIKQNQTEVVDEVEFELPYGLVGKMFEGFASNQLRKIFDPRRRMTIEKLANGG